MAEEQQKKSHPVRISCFLPLAMSVIVLLNYFPVKAQSGGGYVFSFLNLVAPARPAALGGSAIATRADDITLSAMNPALLSEAMDAQVSFSYVGYVAGIRYGNLMAARHLKKWGTLGFNLHYVSYGQFNATDVDGSQTGTFSAGEYAFQLGWSKLLDSTFSIGANMKYILSDLGPENRSIGIAVDAGANWFSRDKLWSASMLIRNAGRQLTTYQSGEREKLPFEIQAGISRQLPKAPFRFSLILQQMQRWDLTYSDPSLSGVDPLTGEDRAEKITFADKALRHVIINTEVLLSKNFNLRFGYNFLRRNELGFTEKKGMSGMSFGLGFRINRFQLSYARTVYNVAGGSNHLTITTNLKSFLKNGSAAGF